MIHPLIAAHRGGAGLWPENSRTAFQGAAALPVEQVEFDVRLSRDGVPYVFHDATLDRVTESAGPVDALDWAALRNVSYRGGGGDAILSLDAALDLLAPSPLGLRIEIKGRADFAPYPGLEALLARALAARGLTTRAQVTSFRLATLAAMADAGAPGLGLLWLLSDAVAGQIGDDATLCALALGVGAQAMAMRVGLLTPARVTAAAACGVALSAYATHDEGAIAHAMACGVAVFTTDRPDLALAARGAWGAA